MSQLCQCKKNRIYKVLSLKNKNNVVLSHMIYAAIEDEPCTCQEKKEEGELIGSIKINQTLSKDDALIITNTFQYDDNGNEVSKSIGYEIKKVEPKPECDHIVGWHTITEYGNDDDDMPFEDLYFVKSKELPVPATLQPLTYFKYCHECGEKLNLKKDE